MEVVLVDRRLAQPAAHPLESLLQLTQLIAPADIHRTRVVALADPLGAFDQRRNGLFELASRAPGQRRCEQATTERQGTGDQQSQADLGLIRRREPAPQARGRRGEDLLDGDAQLAECLRCLDSGNTLNQLTYRLGCFELKGTGVRCRTPPAIQSAAVGVCHGDRADGRVVGEGLQMPRDCGCVARTDRAGNRFRRVGSGSRNTRA